MAATPYLTPDDLKGDPSLARLATIDDATLAAYIAEFEDVAEDYRGVAFTPRTATETVWPSGRTWLLTKPRVRSITTVTIGGTVVPSTAWIFDGLTGIIVVHVGTAAKLWPVAGLPVPTVVTYEHGFDAPPPGLLRACRQYVRAVALRDQQAVERDVVTQGFEGGGYTRYSTPDPAAGRPTGFGEVDRLLSMLPDYRCPVVG